MILPFKTRKAGGSSIARREGRITADAFSTAYIISERIRPMSGKPSDIRQLNQDATGKELDGPIVGETERLAVLGMAAAVFAHEVANPLAGISGSLEAVESLIERQRTDSSFLISMVHIARREVDRLVSLLDEFRALASPQIPDFRPTDLVKSIQEVLACQLDGYLALGIAVDLQFPDPLPPVTADAGKMKQVILNLCKNAVEAMPRGGRLTLRGYRAERSVILEISDTGIGMPEGVDVFELFTTTKPGGSGLGLPLVREIVSAHKGTLAYTSDPGHGTAFKVSLPAAETAIDQQNMHSAFGAAARIAKAPVVNLGAPWI
jgi:signal transduction histidine kinase